MNVNGIPAGPVKDQEDSDKTLGDILSDIVEEENYFGINDSDDDKRSGS